jgi:hypothetical protein
MLVRARCQGACLERARAPSAAFAWVRSLPPCSPMCRASLRIYGCTAAPVVLPATPCFSFCVRRAFAAAPTAGAPGATRPSRAVKHRTPPRLHPACSHPPPSNRAAPGSAAFHVFVQQRRHRHRHTGPRQPHVVFAGRRTSVVVGMPKPQIRSARDIVYMPRHGRPGTSHPQHRIDSVLDPSEAPLEAPDPALRKCEDISDSVPPCALRVVRVGCCSDTSQPQRFCTCGRCCRSKSLPLPHVHRPYPLYERKGSRNKGANHQGASINFKETSWIFHHLDVFVQMLKKGFRPFSGTKDSKEDFHRRQRRILSLVEVVQPFGESKHHQVFQCSIKTCLP